MAEKQALPTWQEITFPVSISSQPESAGHGGMREQQQQRQQQQEQQREDLEAAKVMYACFLVHAYLEKHCGDLAMQVR